jgi:hypothetical protein
MTQRRSNDPGSNDSGSNDLGSNDSESAVKLEQRITELLDEQPLRRAPPALAQRVLSQLEHQQRSAFQRWPLAVRIAFVALCGMAAQLTVELSMLLVRATQAGVAAPRPPLAALLAEAAVAAFRHLPSVWLYGGLAALIVIYGSTFGISVAMYRIAMYRSVSSQP